MRTVVVGASSGLGRCIGIGLAAAGRARRAAGPAPRAPRGRGPGGRSRARSRSSATSPTRSRAARRSTTRPTALGGIDALVYTPAIGPLARLVDTDADTWRRAFDTNVTGAALDHGGGHPPPRPRRPAPRPTCRRSSASLTPPWPGLGAYIVSKAALDKLVEAWRAEHPDIGFTRLVVGDCARRRRRRADGVHHRLGHGARGGARRGVVRTRLAERIADRRRGAGVRGRRGAAQAARQLSMPSVTVAPPRR